MFEITEGIVTVMHVDYDDYCIGFSQEAFDLFKYYDGSIDDGMLLKACRYMTRNNDGESSFELCDELRICGTDVSYLCDNKRRTITVMTSEEIES